MFNKLACVVHAFTQTFCYKMCVLGKMNLQNKEVEQLYFVTDDYYCGRGFHGIYEQIPCQSTEYPDKPVTPENSFPDVSCKKIIQDNIFSIDVDSNTKKCSYVIKKSGQVSI